MKDTWLETNGSTQSRSKQTEASESKEKSKKIEWARPNKKPWDLPRVKGLRVGS
jgi:hypothetical protein